MDAVGMRLAMAAKLCMRDAHQNWKAYWAKIIIQQHVWLWRGRQCSPESCYKDYFMIHNCTQIYHGDTEPAFPGPWGGALCTIIHFVID